MPIENSFNNSKDNTDKNSDKSQGTTFNGSDKNNQNDKKGENESDKKESSHTSEVNVSTLQKRIDDSQEFISVLKNERQQDQERIKALEEDLKNRPSLEEIMEHVNQQSGNKDIIGPNEMINKALEAVDQKLSLREQQSIESTNIEKVSERLKQEFGNDVDKKVAEIAAENDMTFDEVFSLAKKNPKATYKLLGVKNEVPASNTNINSNGMNSLGLGANTSNKQERTDNIMDYTTDKKRVEFFQKRMEKGLSKL